MSSVEARVYARDATLKALVRKWFSFQEALQKGSEEATAEHAAFVALLHEYQFAFERATEAAERVADDDAANVEAVSRKRRELEEVTQRCDELKQAYKQAKVARANNEEYEKLAELVSRYPSQEETVATVNALKKDIEGLEADKKELQTKLALRNSQFQLLLHAVRSLQTALSAK